LQPETIDSAVMPSAADAATTCTPRMTSPFFRQTRDARSRTMTRRLVSFLRVVIAVLAGLGLLPTAHAQCPEGWQPGNWTPGTNGTVSALTMWDPDGSGPQAPRIIVGGNFTFVDSILASHIAAFDPATGQWSALGS